MRNFVWFCLLFVGLVLPGCIHVRVSDERGGDQRGQGIIGVNASGHLSDTSGVIGLVEGDYTGQPADTETWVVGTTTYEADSGGGVTGGRTAVTIGGDADATYANLVTAIDAGADLVDADIPVAGRLRIRTALTAGGTVTPSGSSVAVSEAAANFDWRGANTNQSGLASGLRRRETCTRTVDALFAAASTARVCEFPWTPARIVAVYGSDSSGVPDLWTDQFTISGNAIVWTSAGAIHVANGDKISVLVEE